jgi:hypothetical protein
MSQAPSGPLSRRLARGLGAACCLPLLAFADPLSIRVDAADGDGSGGNRWQVFLAGEIDAGAAERVEQELARLGEGGIEVYFNSPGGSLGDAMRIGNLLRRLGARTTVAKRGTVGSGIEPGLCLSACSLAFLGGVYRYVPLGSLYGVHRVAMAEHTDQDFDAGQIVAAQVSNYVRQMGVDSGLVDRMVKAGKNAMYVLDRTELYTLRVANDGRLPAEWSSAMSGREPSLTGSQQTVEGLEKAVFNCDKGVVVFHSLYQAGSNGPLIASGLWNHSLLVDNRSLPLDQPRAIEDDDGTLSAIFDLSPDQARRIIGASSVGHSMQGVAGGTTALGYRIDIDAGATKTVWSFMESCLRAR